MIDTAIRGIVFDLDGVLIQSAPSHAAAFEQVFAQYGIHDFEYAPYAGWRTSEVIADVLARHGYSVSAEAMAEMAPTHDAVEPSPGGPVDDTTRERLRALGYAD